MYVIVMAVTKLSFQDLLNKSFKELVAMRNDFKKQLFELRMKNALKSLKETHIIWVLRKNVARVNTALTSKNNLQ